MEINEILKIIDKNFAYEYKLVPVKILGDKIYFYVLNEDLDVKKNLEALLNKSLIFQKVDEEKLNRQIKITYKNKFSIENEINKLNVESDNFMENLDDLNSPIAKIIDKIVMYSIEKKASDIHFDPYEKYSTIRIRRDGVLKDLVNIKKEITLKIISRIKILSGLDISEKRLPQDGRMTYENRNLKVDIRVSTVPTVFGEKIVLRILDKINLNLTFDGIGLKANDRESIENLIKQPSGLILVCGPTGSGKTSTIYSILEKIKNHEINIMTIEDHVEYKIEGINQIPVNEKTGLDFEQGLRAILRQDPDKIMVGEIRNVETAKIALRSSITGHLVLSTLHTNNSAQAIIRLKDMGIMNYQIRAGIIGIISQRLVRVLCPHCKIRKHSYVDIFDQEMDYYENGYCEFCDNGYLGRKEVFEILDFTKIRDKIEDLSNLSEIENLAKESGMIELKESFKKLLSEGLISLDEVYKNIFH